ncbi:MAG: hypothetical protein ACLUOI_26975 [Eisenbergiella sp.]
METDGPNAESAPEICSFPSKEAFFEETGHLLREGDTILVKASHAMEFPEIVERLKSVKSAI